MALSADMVWEIRANGTATGGGGFVSGASGTDYSQQDAVQSTRTDIVIDGADNTKITSAADNFAADDVGNVLNITSGTGFTTGRYEVTAVAAGVATLDRGCGTTGSTGGNGVLGGAMTLTDGNLEDVVDANIIYIKADGTHTLTGAINLSNAATRTDPIRVYGYNSARDDGIDSESNRPTIACGANAFVTNEYWYFYDFIFTGTTTEVVFIESNALIARSKVTNSSGTANRHAIELDTTSAAFFCEVISTNGRGMDMGNSAMAYGCYAHDCGNRGFDATSTVTRCIYCIADTCVKGFYYAGTGYASAINCTAYNNSSDGFHLDGSVRHIYIINAVIDSNGNGIRGSSTNWKSSFFMNINFSNNSTDKNTIDGVINETTLDPQFVDAPNGDFRTKGNMKSIGAPGAFPGGLSTGYPDLGAVQGLHSVNLLGGKL